jgi:uncharacterized protein YcaQ
VGCKATQSKAADVLAFVRERGRVHPREVDEHFAHGRVTNYWGGSSNATTHLLDGMHYRGLLRVKRRDSGTRVYELGPCAGTRRQPRGADETLGRAARTRGAQVRAACRPAA